MSSCSRVALVTGANKGIGFAIARELCRQFSGDVVLTARDAARGQAAVQQLQAEGLSPRFHQLDINDLQSIRALRDFLRKEYGGLDVLVNNAGIAFKSRCGSGRSLGSPRVRGSELQAPPYIHSSDGGAQHAPPRMPSVLASAESLERFAQLQAGGTPGTACHARLPTRRPVPACAPPRALPELPAAAFCK